MIYITADTHGEIERFSSKHTKKLKALDTLFVAGDFGFVWRSKEREKNLKKLAKLPYKILFIDGYHEDFEALSAYPDTVYRGAAAKEIAKDKIYYIKRGEILQTDDVKILCFGGADDPTDDLFSDNVPNEKDFENCLANLEKVGGSVDYIITHSPSGRTVRFLDLNSNSIFDFAALSMRWPFVSKINWMISNLPMFNDILPDSSLEISSRSPIR